MLGKQNGHTGTSYKGVHNIIKEKLNGSDVELTSFLFRPGGNVYVLSYRHKGTRRHAFIDACDGRYRHTFLPLLAANGINPSEIEMIFITHRHPDHWGLLDLLARNTKAKVMVHPAFKDFVEGRLKPQEKWWLREYDTALFKSFNIQYLPLNNGKGSVGIDGRNFPRLGKPIVLGDTGVLEVLAPPDSAVKHTPDQLLVLYSPSKQLQNTPQNDLTQKPTDDIIFTGDLWLMRGPIYDYSFISRLPRIIRFKYFQLKNLLKGKTLPRLNVMEQDAEAKDALKKGFDLIRVKPGHGDEFIGTKLLPQSILADRDFLNILGFPLDSDKSILKQGDVAPKVTKIKEDAFISFIEQLRVWKNWGYTDDEISKLIIRIYQEQEGGKGTIKKDRKERRKRIIALLYRLSIADSIEDDLKKLGNATLVQLK